MSPFEASFGLERHMVSARRRLALVLTVLASACGHHEDHAKLTIIVSGPGLIALSNVPASSCDTTCSLDVTPGTVVSLTTLPRPGAAVVSLSPPCAGDTCSLQVDADTSVSAAFTWVPLPHVTRYSWKRIDDGTSMFADLDSAGNAVGYTFNVFHPNYPIRFDASLGRTIRIPGALDRIPIAMNDQGVVILEGAWRYENGTASRIVDTGGAPLVATDVSYRGWTVGLRWLGVNDAAFNEYQPWVHDGTSLQVWGNVTAPTDARAVNAEGRVVGARAVRQSFPTGRAIVSYSVEIRRDGTDLLAIDEPSSPHDVSDTGLVVGGLSSLGPRSRGYVYDLSTRALKVLSPLGDDVALLLLRVNPSGTVAVGSRLLRDGRTGAAVYFVAEDRLVALESLVDLPPNASLSFVRAVNVFGQILVAATFGDDAEDPGAELILTPE